MISSIIGQTFLDEYNKVNNLHYTPKEFFKRIFIPLFFDHPVYMMKGGNAPLDNPKIKKGQFPDNQERFDRISKTITLIDTYPEASSAIGYPSNDFEATTSGQVTNISLKTTAEQVYLSWLGGALGIGVNGGFSIFFNYPQILMDIFKGWQIYRQLLKDTPRMKGNQIETWNGHWLTYYYHSNGNDASYFTNMDALESKNGIIQLNTQSWVSLLFEMSIHFSEGELVGYVYNLGQMNTTIGFIPFQLYQINRPMQLYRKYFGDLKFTKDLKKIHKIYSTNYGFKAACATGNVGLKAIEPKGLKSFLPHESGRSKFFKFTDENENQINYNTFLTWVCAMIDNETLIGMAESVAGTLIKFEAGAEKAKKDRVNLTIQLLDCISRKKFIESLVPIIEKASKEEANAINDIVAEINKMPAENFKYFVTLIRFKYAFLKK